MTSPTRRRRPGNYDGNRPADVADDGGEDEDAHEEVQRDEDEFNVADGRRRLADRRQRQRRPVETVDVPTQQRVVRAAKENTRVRLFSGTLR